MSRELYKDLFKNSFSIMLIIHPKTGVILDANTSACTYYGYKKSEIKNICIQDINTLSKEEVQKEMQDAKDKNRNYFNFKHRLASGEVKDVEVFSGPITIDNEKVLYSIIHDISERKKIEKLQKTIRDKDEILKRAEQEKKNSKEWSRTFNSINDFIFLLDTEHTIIKVNKSFCDILKLKPEEIIGKKYYELLHKSDAPLPSCPVEIAFKTKKPASAEIIDPNIGIPLLVSVSPILNEKNEIIGAVHVAKDISESKKVQQELLKAKEFSDTTIESLPGIFYIFDKNGHFIKWNKNFTNVVEYSDEEIEKISPLDIFEGESREHIKNRILETFTKGESYAEADLLTKSGKKIPYYFTGRLMTMDGKLYLVGMGIDITERKKTENELQKSNSLLSSVIQSPGNIIIYALDVNYNIISFNETLVKIMKRLYDADIEIGQNMLAYISNRDDRLQAEESYKRVIKGERFVKIDKYGPPSCRLWYELIFNPIYDILQHVAGFTVFITDITERKQYEKLYRKNQKLEALGSLAGGMAHDFNNILMGILGSISLAKIKFPKDHPGYRYLEESEQSINRAANLANKLLTFSSGGAPIKENTRLGRDIEEVLRFDLSDSNVTLDFKQAEDPWIANVDKAQIQQVFSNLTKNAIQAMPNGGILYITLENADIKGDTVSGINQGKYIKGTVQDKGVGIDCKNLDRVFDPFFSTKEIGRGLGLSTAYSIIKKHGG